MLKIENIDVTIEEKVLLKNFSLKVKKGEVHAIMGPNGAGKSTLAKALAGHPKYLVKKGEINFKGNDLLNLEPEERALLNIFVSFQYPLEINGISNFEFLFACFKERQKAKKEKSFIKKEAFEELLLKQLKNLEIREEFIFRNVNEGFSGGEKKKNEILQMALFAPELTVLDEIDSGLDVDALKIVVQNLKELKNENNALILITHYQRLLDYIVPDFVHVVINGRIVKTGTALLAKEIEEKGYEGFFMQEALNV